MNENLLQYIWQYQRLKNSELITSCGRKFDVVAPGKLNEDAGPDFFNSRIRIGKQLWVGNVEVHIQSSDWYKHRHHVDKAYSNVILHVVWSHDQEVFIEGRRLLVLVLKGVVPLRTLNTYRELLYRSYHYIHCEPLVRTVPDIIWEKWKERLFIERVSTKVNGIENLLSRYANDWEKVFFVILSRYLGGKVNSSSFEQFASGIPFRIIRAERSTPGNLEALFFGQAGWLNHSLDFYGYHLREKYNHLKRKYGLSSMMEGRFKFFRLRPGGFPTLRMVQLAMIYEKDISICWTVLRSNSVEDLYELFQFDLPEYWKTHYKIGVERKSGQGRLTRKLLNKMIVNAFLPFRMCFERQKGYFDLTSLLDLVAELPPESNHLIEKFDAIGVKAKSLRDSQALIQLKTSYCDDHRCLNCSIGCDLLKN